MTAVSVRRGTYEDWSLVKSCCVYMEGGGCNSCRWGSLVADRIQAVSHCYLRCSYYYFVPVQQAEVRDKIFKKQGSFKVLHSVHRL